ncbi:MAG: Holliday junction branch migration protein RuvA [Clostridia bacterium]|nr:Holliday junction branch migration protein RuvA [Clostridia bacterium]
MFYYISGRLAVVGDGFAVIDCGGVGYRLTVSSTTLAELPSIGASAGNNLPAAKLYTYLSVKEDAVELFGFYTMRELETYKLLISISGVGPKAAMSILSLMSPDALSDAVASQNVKLISKAPGVGTKTAQRIVLELSGKLAAVAGDSGKGAAESVATEAIKEAEDALVVLGYSRAEAASAVHGVADAAKKTTEELIRAALSRLV